MERTDVPAGSGQRAAERRGALASTASRFGFPAPAVLGARRGALRTLCQGRQGTTLPRLRAALPLPGPVASQACSRARGSGQLTFSPWRGLGTFLPAGSEPLSEAQQHLHPPSSSPCSSSRSPARLALPCCPECTTQEDRQPRLAQPAAERDRMGPACPEPREAHCGALSALNRALSGRWPHCPGLAARPRQAVPESQA